MPLDTSRSTDPSCSRRPNIVAILITSIAVGSLYGNFNPDPAGSEIDDDVSQASMIMPLFRMPTAVRAEYRVAAIDPAMAYDGAADFDRLVEPPDIAPELFEESAESRLMPTGQLSGRLALLMNVLLLEKGEVFMSGIDSYTGTFEKIERVDGQLRDREVMTFNLRHSPFSVYMKWKIGDRGREVLYVEGQHDGNMLVKVGGLKGRFLPAINLDPHGATAMSECRHPICKAGLRGMIRDLLADRRHDLEAGNGVECVMLDDQVLADRDSYCFLMEFRNQDYSPLYRKSLLLVDKEMSIPVKLVNYTWSRDSEGLTPEELDNVTLIEDYTFTNLKMDVQLADATFDRNNKSYRFRR